MPPFLAAGPLLPLPARKASGRAVAVAHLGDDLARATFIRRANRFLAYVELDGRETSVHVANSGRLRELFVPGATVWLKPVVKAPDSGRKTAYDLALVEAAGTLVSADAPVAQRAGGRGRRRRVAGGYGASGVDPAGKHPLAKAGSI